jgi:hypothetical protein
MQRTIDDFDPFSYGGNIAAACAATNQSISEGKEQELNADEEKKRQRASNRLTAWQSRERKRIEFEVMKERKAEITKKNEDLKRENEQLRLLIQKVKEGKRVGGGAACTQQATPTTTAANQQHSVLAASNLAAAKLKLQQQQDKMRFPLFPASNMRRELPPHLMSLPVGMLQQHGASNAPYIQQGVGQTIFAPLERQQQQHLQHQLHQAFQLGNLNTNAPDIASQMPYFRTLAHLSSTKKKDTQEESSSTPPNKKSRTHL